MLGQKYDKYSRNKIFSIEMGKNKIKKRDSSVKTVSKKKKKIINSPTNSQIKISSINQIINKQTKIEMNQIKSSIALNHYYNCLIMMFMTLYTASQIIFSNMFQKKKIKTGLDRLKFIGIIIQAYETYLDQKQLQKLKKIAINVMKMSSKPSQFQSKIQFVSRKIVLNSNKRDQIEHSFLNIKLCKFWDSLQFCLRFKQDCEFLMDWFQLPPQKMCYWDFHTFVNQELCGEQFTKILRESTNLQYMTEYQQQCYTFQFKLIQMFCFQQKKQKLQLQYKSCHIM